MELIKNKNYKTYNIGEYSTIDYKSEIDKMQIRLKVVYNVHLL